MVKFKAEQTTMAHINDTVIAAQPGMPVSARLETTVQLTSADSAQLSVPGTVTIPAGESQRSFTLTAVEDTLVERTNSYTVTAAAAGFAPASVGVSVEDNDRPAVSLSLTSRTVSEGAGPNATTATLTRSPVTSRAVTVAMVSGDPDAVRVPTSVVIPANGASVSFPVAAVDNAIVDGSRVVTLGGSVLDSVTGSAVAEIAPDILTVTDNDGPTLIVFLEDEVVPEGRSPATRGSVLRNTSTESTLTVNLASSDVAEARVPASVTIPAGTNRVDFEVASVNDGVSDGNRTVTITATAPGFTTGTTQLVVSDADRPDLVVSRIQIPAESITGGQVAVAFRVENRGVVASTNPIVQRAYLSSDNVLGNDTLAAQITHEIRNPLSSLSLNAELLQEALASEQDLPAAREELRSIVRAMGREVDRLAEVEVRGADSCPDLGALLLRLLCPCRRLACCFGSQPLPA
jgi:hypothetical protein